ncbi:MAG TPA: LuxR C-terminal-related transcriptional regulator [Gemmatimonadaceae bacterium]|jgi:DNA-directed RNA polymerase specialized sigma24 family protein
MRALTDAALIDIMRAGVPEAWAEFDARFRPLLERYAARVGIPRWDWSVCITEVLDDEALRLIERAGQVPSHLTAYLVRAVRNRFLELKRSTRRRDRRYAMDGVVGAVMSEHAHRVADPTRIAEEARTASSPAARFGEALGAYLSREEQQMLAWVAEGVPHRLIAEWLGITREAAKKRIARLCRRLRTAAREAAARLPLADRREIDRLMRRATAPPDHSHSGERDDGTR